MTPLLLALALSAGPATPAPTADEPASLVLIVASNRGAQRGRPPLQYADDDGAKYFEVFSTIAGEENTVLLTDLDRDTARLFARLVDRVRSPTRAQLDHAAARLARKAAEAARLGRAVRFYFVFAGHGDVDQGRGFLDLPDGPFTADDLQALLRLVGATEAHVILDSCNSFFVVNPRKPGGVRFATPRDAAEMLGRRLPNVGVFLSTSAHAEVYEWSELQSGVFSHAVRSGLMGAADANGDGRVSYEELAGFVETAAADIKNPLYRPMVYARGPNGEDARAILAFRGGPRTVLTVDDAPAVRLAARDVDGLRWLDAYKEPGGRLELWFPPRVARRLEIDRLKTDEGERDQVDASFRLDPPGDAPARLSGLAAASSTVAMRGPGDIFQALFARPFGPTALAAYLARRSAEPPPELVVEQPAPAVAVMQEVAAPEPASTPREPERGGKVLLAVRPGFAVAFDSTSGARPSLAVSAGAALTPWLAVEVEGGYRDSTHAWDHSYPSPGYYTNLVADTELRIEALPLALNLRFQVPQARPRPYLIVGAGVALVLTTLDPADFNATLQERHDVPFLNAGLGLTFDVGTRLFAGLEGRYWLMSDFRAFKGTTPWSSRGGNVQNHGVGAAGFLGVRL